MTDKSCASFTDLEDEVKQEFYEDVVSAIADVNACVSELDSGIDDSVIDRMFRAIHTVKGNCNMVFLVDFVDAAHCLEDLFSIIRAKKIGYDPVYGKFAIQIVNLLKIQLKQLIDTTLYDEQTLNNVKLLVHQIQSSNSNDQVISTQKAIAAIEAGHFNLSMVVGCDGKGVFNFNDATDEEFFEFIIHRYNKHSDSIKLYTIFRDLANSLNEMLNNSVFEQQLKAAIIFLHICHRIGADGKIAKMTVEQCIVASGMLSRMSGWGNAADLCIQAMENFDGSGAPRSLKGDDILPAAQVLALSFEFAQIIVNSSESNYKKKLFDSVKAINAHKNVRYKEKLIQRFNTLIKSEYLTNKMF